MKRTAILGIAAVLAAVTIIGCAGNGSTATITSPFAGARYIGFYDEDGSNSSWMGNLEILIESDGEFASNGGIYTSQAPGMQATRSALDNLITTRHNKIRGTAGGGGGGGYESHEGTITSGSIKPDGTFHWEGKVDMQGWPAAPLDDPYWMVGDGKVTRRGHHWEGSGTIRYYDVGVDGKPGAIRKEIPYDFDIRSGVQ